MEQRALFQFSMDNALEMIIMFDVGGTIVYANQSAKKQLEYEEDLRGKSISDVFMGEFCDEGGLLHLRCEENDDLKTMMAYRRNRTCFPTKVRLLSYEDTHNLSKEWNAYSGKPLYICTAYNCSTEDFLEKRVHQVEMESREAEKVKTEFVANVTHELRTPVNGILGNTKELITKENEKDKLKLLHLVERGCRDMNAIINNILDFSKLEAGKFVLENQKFDFRNMLEYVKGNHSNRIIEKGLDFSMKISPDIPEYVVGDELRIVQVLNNLISNAYKFTSIGAIHVEVVQTAQSGNRVELFFMVIDNGIGISKSDQDKLFKSFSQVDASISRKYGGTGLGLNICKQLVELMGGNIHVESEEGKGSIFSFHIWVELPKEDCTEGVVPIDMDVYQGHQEETNEQVLIEKLQKLSENRVSEKVWRYGEQENREEIEKKMSKLILSIEMENWEKAESFTETIKQLVEEAPREIKSAALRMKMAVQKGDYDKSIAAYEKMQEVIQE